MVDTRQWPEQYRSVVEATIEHLGYTALVPIRDLSGASGALTRLCRPEGSQGRPNVIVVKVGKAETLQRDLDGMRVAAAYFRDAASALADAKTVGGCTCIPLRVAGSDAMTLEDYYDGATGPADIEQLLEELFNDVLRLPDLAVRPVTGNAFTLYQIDDDRRMAVALREAGDAVPGLLDWWRYAEVLLVGGSYSRLCHGDLHGRNVLVGGEPRRAYVVDFGHTREHHAVRDLAKLEREIHLTMLGSSHAGRWAPGPFAPVSEVASDSADVQLAKASTAIGRLRSLARTYLPASADAELEYAVALLAQFMFAAANENLPMVTRRAGLLAAEGIRDDIVAHDPTLALPDEQRRQRIRQEALWRFIYTFTRLDQQPAGGWSRTIVQWMNQIWAGDDGEIFRDPKMRRRGGTDLTCYTVDGLVCALTERLHGVEMANLFTHNQTIWCAVRHLTTKIGYKGGSGTGMSGAASADVKIRHTAMTAIAALRYRQAHDYAIGATSVLRPSLTYLKENLAHWSLDRAFPFGMAMSCAKLYELLGTRMADQLEASLVADTRTELEQALPAMIEALESHPEDVKYQPPPPSSSSPLPPFFQPYCGFWRMERSGFLMYAAFGIQENHAGLIDPVGKSLGRRFVQCFTELLAEVAPFDPAAPECSLVRFHRGDDRVPRDWGLSAELAALLESSAVQDLIVDGDASRQDALDAKRSSLRAALLATFDRYSERPELFTFIQGASILRAWRVFPATTVTQADISFLDASIDRLRSQHITGWDVDQHVRNCVVEPAGGVSVVDVSGLRQLLVDKLESGEYIENDAVWEAIADRASGLGGSRSVHAWRPSAVDPTMIHLRGLLGQADVTSPVLDIASDGGPITFAQYLAEWGFRVSILRLSPDGASSHIECPDANATAADRSLSDGSYAAATLGEAILRVPKSRVPALCADVFRLLRVGGLFMVTIRTGDHALIDTQGRFVQYFRDSSGLSRILKQAGFDEATVLQPGTTPWVTLFARKSA